MNTSASFGSGVMSHNAAMTQKAENTLLFRRFVLLALAIALSGMLLAELLVQTHPNRTFFTVHDRNQQWEQLDKDAATQSRCGDKTCLVTMKLTSFA